MALPPNESFVAITGSPNATYQGFPTSATSYLQGLKEGFIDYIATDHAPHTLQEKFKNFQPENVEKMDMNEQAYKDLLASNFNDCKSKCLKNGTSGTPQLDTFALIAAW